MSFVPRENALDWIYTFGLLDGARNLSALWGGGPRGILTMSELDPSFRSSRPIIPKLSHVQYSLHTNP